MLLLSHNTWLPQTYNEDIVDGTSTVQRMLHHINNTHLTGMFLLVHHCSTMSGGVVLHGHAVALLHVVRHLAVRVEGLAGSALFALVEAAVGPVDGGAPHRQTLGEQLAWQPPLLLQHNTGCVHLKQRFVWKGQV